MELKKRFVNSLSTILAAAGVVTLATMIVGIGQSQKMVLAQCNTDDIQRAIIQMERPKMGPLEVEFWRKAIAAAADAAGIGHYAAEMTAKIAVESNFDRFRVSTAGAKCAAQIMPMHYKSPDDIAEIESCLTLGAKIFAKELKNCETVDRALRCYYSGPNNSKRGTLRSIPGYDLGKYSDAILARVYLAKEAVCTQTKGATKL